MSVIIDLADAIVSELNDATLSQEFTATRLYRPIFELSELSDPTVSVVPRSMGITGATRVAMNYDFAVDIGIQRKVLPTATDVLDAMMLLVEEIADFLRFRQLADVPAIAWVAIENDPVYSPEHLDQQHVFTSVLTVRYRTRR